MPPSPIVSAAVLRAELEGPEPPALLDVRWRMGADDGREAFAAGHLPGAHFIDLPTELSGPGRPEEGRHPLPDPAVLQAALRRCGVRAGGSVVAYDATGGLSAGRAWWLLRWGVLADVRVLDGGLAAWKAAGGTLETGEPADGDGDVVITPGQLPVLDADGVAALAATGLVLDARPPARFRGEDTVDAVHGHIPGSRNAPATDVLGEDGRFLDPATLRARFAALGARAGEPVGASCGSGVTAAHLMVALELAGFDAVLYPPSWSGYSADPSRPVATGR